MRSNTCPLCGKKAGYTVSCHGKEKKCYSCKHCYNFIISEPAEKIISEYPQQQRLSYSIKSKNAFVCQVLVIDATEADGQRSIDFKYDPERNWY